MLVRDAIVELEVLAVGVEGRAGRLARFIERLVVAVDVFDAVKGCLGHITHAQIQHLALLGGYGERGGGLVAILREVHVLEVHVLARLLLLRSHEAGVLLYLQAFGPVAKDGLLEVRLRSRLLVRLVRLAVHERRLSEPLLSFPVNVPLPLRNRALFINEGEFDGRLFVDELG